MGGWPVFYMRAGVAVAADGWTPCSLLQQSPYPENNGDIYMTINKVPTRWEYDLGMKCYRAVSLASFEQVRAAVEAYFSGVEAGMWEKSGIHVRVLAEIGQEDRPQSKIEE